MCHMFNGFCQETPPHTIYTQTNPDSQVTSLQLDFCAPRILNLDTLVNSDGNNYENRTHHKLISIFQEGQNYSNVSFTHVYIKRLQAHPTRNGQWAGVEEKARKETKSTLQIQDNIIRVT